ncbi:MAG: PAS domain S-box protein [Planctomycetaceae bacterium]|nr:MAG: PAS domain S-box protein [Planctomycetaceae bacterium]
MFLSESRILEIANKERYNQVAAVAIPIFSAPLARRSFLAAPFVEADRTQFTKEGGMIGEPSLTPASSDPSSPPTESGGPSAQLTPGDEGLQRLEMLLGVYDTLLDRYMPPSILIDASRRVIDTFAGADRFLRIGSRRPSPDLLELLLEPFRSAVAEGLARCASTGQSVVTPPIAIDDFDCGSDRSAGRDCGNAGASNGEGEPFWFRARISVVPHRVCELPFFSIAMEDVDRTIPTTTSDIEISPEPSSVPPFPHGPAHSDATPAPPDPGLAFNTGMARTSAAGNRSYLGLAAAAPWRVRETAPTPPGDIPMPPGLESFFEANSLALIVLDPELRIRQFSTPAADLFGLLPHDVGREFRTFAGGIEAGDLMDRIEQVLRTGDADEFELRQARVGRYHLARLVPLGDPAGSAGLILTLIDLSSLEADRRECQGLSDIVRSSADAIISRDTENRITSWNAAAEELYGYSAAEMIGEKIDRITPEMDEQERLQWLRAIRREPSADHLEVSRQTKRGDLVRVSVRMSPIYDNEQRVIGVSTIERDISDRAEMVSKLSQSEQLLQAFYDHSPEMHCSLELPSGTITDCNRSMEKKLGIPRDQIVGRSMIDLQTEASRGLAGLALDQLQNVGMLHGEELELRKRNGGTLPVSLCAMAIHDNEGNLIGARSLWRDLTELRDKDELIRRSEAKRREAFHNSAIGIAHCDLDGRIIQVNKRLCDIVGYSNDELVGRAFAEITHPDDLPREAPLRKNLLSGQQETYQIEKRYFHRSGRIVWVTIYASLERDASGRPLAFHKYVEDISPRMELENELRLAIRQRDQFLAMLSHELRNPLGAILNTCAVLGRRRGLSKQLQGEVLIVSRQARQMADLLDDLLDVSRITTGKIKLEKTLIELARIADEAIESQQSLAKSRGQRLAVTYSDEPLLVFGDRSRLVQIVVNLLNNAIKYTGDGGMISVILERRGRTGVIRVRDTGVGLEPDQIESLFEMFAQKDSTLDRSGGGMGLGLHLVRKLVDFHSGRVTGQSEGVGKGSEFVVELPLSSRRITEDRPRRHASRLATRPKVKRIVVVEDIEDARKMLVALLEADNYQVLSAADGEAGLQMILRERPDLAIVDIGLPKLDGYEVARRVREELSAADLRLVALTGYGQDSDHEMVMQAGFDTHLVKPLNHTRLEKILAGF